MKQLTWRLNIKPEIIQSGKGEDGEALIIARPPEDDEIGAKKTWYILTAPVSYVLTRDL